MAVRRFVHPFEFIAQIEIRPIVTRQRNGRLFHRFRMKTLTKMETVLADERQTSTAIRIQLMLMEKGIDLEDSNDPFRSGDSVNLPFSLRHQVRAERNRRAFRRCHSFRYIRHPTPARWKVARTVFGKPQSTKRRESLRGRPHPLDLPFFR